MTLADGEAANSQLNDVQKRILDLVRGWPKGAIIALAMFVVITLVSTVGALEQLGIVDFDKVSKFFGMADKISQFTLAALGLGGIGLTSVSLANANRSKSEAKTIAAEVETLAPASQDPDIGEIIRDALKGLNALPDGKSMIDTEILARVEKLIADGELLRNSLAKKDADLSLEKEKSSRYLSVLTTLFATIRALPDLAPISDTLKIAAAAQDELRKFAEASAVVSPPESARSAGGAL